MNNFKYLIPLMTSLILVGCGGSKAATPEAKEAPDVKVVPVVKQEPETTTPVLTLSFTPTKTFHFEWAAVSGATSYKLKEAITTASGYEVLETTTATSFDHVVPLYARLNAKYILESCISVDECTPSAEVFTMPLVTKMVTSIGYFKASNNTGRNGYFGASVSLSEDGTTLAVGAWSQDSEDELNAGAVYVFTRINKTGAAWSEQTYLKASNAGANDYFGRSVSLSADGHTLVVGSPNEDSTGAENSGAAYVFIRSDVTWAQQAVLRATNKDENDYFGNNVSLNLNGNTIAVGATGDDDTATNSGAVHVFIRDAVDPNSDSAWSQSAPVLLKADNAVANDYLGESVSLSADGDTLAVGTSRKDTSTGAVYVFIRNDSGAWPQQDYLKASNAASQDQFGHSVSLSADGDILAVGAIEEDSSSKLINTGQDNNATSNAGAVYVFIRDAVDPNKDDAWTEQDYLKASNADTNDRFGHSVSLSADGNTLAVGSRRESSNAAGISGIQSNNEADGSGAVYTFTRPSATWSQQAYIKARYPTTGDLFGFSVALSSDGDTLAVGADNEKSLATGVNSDPGGSGQGNAGAVYVY